MSYCILLYIAFEIFKFSQWKTLCNFSQSKKKRVVERSNKITDAINIIPPHYEAEPQIVSLYMLALSLERFACFEMQESVYN